MPTRRPGVTLRRGGTTFWRTLADHGFRSTVIQVPVSFPSEDLPGGQLLAGLSVPDIRGTQGTFHYYASDLTREEVEDTEMGGKLVRIELRDGRAETEILGPWDPVLRDRRRKLRERERRARGAAGSRWTSRSLPSPTSTASAVSTWSRSARSCASISDRWSGTRPNRPWTSAPPGSSRASWPARSSPTRRGAGRWTPPRYDAALAAERGDAILRIYRRMDRIVERVHTEHVRGDTLFALMSDHGFHSFNRSVNINTWLVRNGFMFLRGMEETDYNLEHLFGGGDFWPNVVWERTKAYSMDLGQIHVNLAGREAEGCVQEGAEYDRIVGRIIDGLLALRDTRGERVVLNAYRGREVYHGPYLDEAPDVPLGFNEGYRVSWQTCLGGVPAEVIEDNPRTWSGDHCSFDASISPGILFINRPLARDPHLPDLAPTVLDHFGVKPPPAYDGASLL